LEARGKRDRRKSGRSFTGRNRRGHPWLKLEVVNNRGDGPLKNVATVQRINTAGGNLDGACEKVGDLRAKPYAADYIFLKRTSP